MTGQRSEKHELARNSLPEDLIPVFDDLVAEYRFAATKHHGSPFVSYIVLADLVKGGWRLTEEPDDAKKRVRDFRKVSDELPLNLDFDKLFYSDDAWKSVASGYQYAGGILCEAYENSKSKRSSLLFPILFCYRHFLELMLKGLIQLNAQLPASSRLKPPRGHFLEGLQGTLGAELSDVAKSTTSWTNAKDVDGERIEGTQVGSVEDDLLLLKDWCDRFAAADRGSDRFRYPVDKKHSPYDYPDLRRLLGCKDGEELKSEMAKLSEAIHNISTAIAGEIELE